MTLVISTLTSSGIVLSADSRQTYRNIAGVIRIGSDSATKVFKLTDRCGVAISGRAFLIDGDQQQKDVGYFITQFKRIYDAERSSTESKEYTIKEIAEKLNNYLADIFVKRDKEIIKKQIEELV